MSTLYKYVNDILNLVLKGTKLWRFLAILLAIFLITSINSEAQNAQSAEYKVTGKIMTTTGESLPGANIVIKGTTVGATTDSDGNYTLYVPSRQDTLTVSYIGYQSRTIPIKGRNVINIRLTEQAISGHQLVVIGYGSIQQKDVTGSISSVSSDQLSKSVSGSALHALQGTVAGVVVTPNSGQPGGGVSIHIRGINTLNANSQPLYVIDGVEYSGYTGNQTSALASLDPSNIKSIEVLKDASAEAIYGEKGANGVVVITTKQGRAGHTEVKYDAYMGVQQLPKMLNVMNLRQYATFLNEWYKTENWTPEAQFADPSILGNGTNWQKALFSNAPMDNQNLSITGGNKKTTYMLSANYFNQQGIATASWFKRYAVRLNLNSKPADWLTVGSNLNLDRTNQRLNSSYNNIIWTAIQQTPDIPVHSPGGGWGGPSQAQFTLNNPVGMAKLMQNYQRISQVIGDIFANINFTNYLTLRQSLDGTFSFTNASQFKPTYDFGAITNSYNTANFQSNNNSFWVIKTYLTLNKDVLKNFNVNAMVGHEAQVSSYEGITGYRETFPTNGSYVLSLGDASTAQNGGYKGSSSIESFFGRVILNYRQRYLLKASLRRDGSSNFGTGYQWGYFPSVAVAWRVSQEPFLREIGQISNLKLRLSDGEVGNQNIPTGVYTSTLGVFPTRWGSGLLPTNIANPFVKWESTHEYNAGLDLGLFNQRIQLTADVYLRRTHGLLLSEPLPMYAGTGATGSPSPPVVNIGSIQNKGIELSLNTINTNSDLVWKTGIVFSMNRNKVLSLSQGNKPIDETAQAYYSGFDNTSVVTRTEVGHPIGELYGYVVQGIIKNANELQNHALPASDQGKTLSPNTTWIGDYMFKDISGPNGKPDGVIDTYDRTYLGNTQPLFQYGITNNFYYKNFDLTIFLNGNYGNKIYNYLRQEMMNMSSRFNHLEGANNYAKLGLKDPNGSPNDMNNVVLMNPTTNVPRITTSDPNQNDRISSAYVEDGSYLRIQNVVLGYTLPARITSELHIKRLRVYGQVQNLYTFTKFKGYDPAVAAGSQTQNALVSGMDYGQYPSSRIYTFGINLSF